jgi:hypothetical protein
MYLGKYNIPNNWTLLSDLITINTAQTYTVQNIGNDNLLVQETNAAPVDKSGFIVIPFEVFVYRNTGINLYLCGGTTVVIKEN